ncbi:HAD family phosphatase [Sphingomonas sp. LR60]|uniref:HAD family hydrolase n=1 Tax=Sphingomonas sp. LR60 TaxID=3050233 RepID=UPI002FE06525
MTGFDALLFDFDGVLIESEATGNRHLATYLSGIGYPTTPEETMAQFMGLAGKDFLAAIEAHIVGPIPPDFQSARRAEDERCLLEGIAEVSGATAFVRSLPEGLPRAVVSSSRVRWIATHLEHLGLRAAFGEHLYSGAEHVTNGKPAPDLYLYAAEKLGVAIDRCAIIEDSPVGATGAVASGAFVIGLVAGAHCAPNHGDRLRAIGVDAVARNFDEVATILSL